MKPKNRNPRKILVTGENSFLGLSLKKHLESRNESLGSTDYVVHTISLRDDWASDSESFNGYDVLFHVAGIVHSDGASREAYRSVNTELAIHAAKKAKESGINQFIFMSSSHVYGDSGQNGHGGRGNRSNLITKGTRPNPNTPYGKSKLEAEKEIRTLADESFKVAIIRSPMVYGRGCKGNYPRLKSLALKTPVFPKIDNQRSMVYVENLMEFVRQLIDNNDEGIFWPQNKEYVNTSDMVKQIAKSHGKRIWIVGGFDGLIKLAAMMSKSIRKASSSMMYDQGMSIYGEYNLYGFEESIRRTEYSGD